MTRPRTPQSWLGRNTLVALADIAQEAHSSVLGRVVRALARHGHLNGVTQTQKSARLDHGKDDGAGSPRQTFDGPSTWPMVLHVHMYAQIIFPEFCFNGVEPQVVTGERHYPGNLVPYVPSRLRRAECLGMLMVRSSTTFPLCSVLSVFSSLPSSHEVVGCVDWDGLSRT